MRFLFALCVLAVILAIFGVLVLGLGLLVAKFLSMIVDVPLAEALLAGSIFTGLLIHYFVKFLSFMYGNRADGGEVAVDGELVAIPRDWLFPRRRPTGRVTRRS